MNYQQVRASDCRSWAAKLRDGLAHFEIVVNPASDVGQMLRALEWLGTFPPDSPQPDTAYQVDRRRTIRCFPLVEQAVRIAEAVQLARLAPGAKDRVRWLKKRLNRLETQSEGAQDFLFELELAARFIQRGISTSFEEPDIVMRTVDGHRLAMACKRPRNVQRMRERLEKAAEQIVATADQGLIIVGVEPLFHASGKPDKPTIVYLGDEEMVRAEAERILEAAIQEAATEIAKALDMGVAGILFCGIVTGWATAVAPGKDAYHTQWVHRAISHPDALGLAEAVESFLFPDA